VTEDVVRAAALARGLVDVKVCAIDETWSGLKLVVPVKDRPRVRSGAGRRENDAARAADQGRAPAPREDTASRRLQIGPTPRPTTPASRIVSDRRAISIDGE